MAIKLAKTAGFCFGVRRALEMALSQSHNKNIKLQTFGPLIHNQQVIDLLKSKNICYSEKTEEINAQKILIRAHGVTPEIKKNLEEKGVDIVDATCPHVSKAQNILYKYAKEGYSSVIIGDKGHAEVVGLLGYTMAKGYVIEDTAEVESLPQLEKLCIVAQTTQSEEKFNAISSALKKKYPDAVIYKTICNATSKRQTELLELAKTVDLMIIVGGRKSANTTRLFDLSKESGTPTIHIETADELKSSRDEIRKYKNIGVTAGASTPYWIIRNVVEDLEEIQRQNNPLIFITLYRIARALVYSNIFLALGAAILTLVAFKMMNIESVMLSAAISFLYILSMHLLNKYLSLPNDSNLTYGSLKFFTRHQKILLAIAGISIVAAFLLTFTLSSKAFFIMLLSLFAGIIYSLTIFPENWKKIIRYRSLKEIPGSKDFFSAIGWVIVVVLLPFIENYSRINFMSALLSSLIVFSLVFSRSVLLDLRDIEGDITIGRETIPVLIGFKNAFFLAKTFLVMAFILPAIGAAYEYIPPYNILLILVPLYVFIADTLIKKINIYHIWYYDALIDLQFVLAGLIVLLGGR